MPNAHANNRKLKRRILNSQSPGKISRGAVADAVVGVHLVHTGDGWAVKTNGVRGRVEIFNNASEAKKKAQYLARRRGTRVFVHNDPSEEIEFLIRQSKVSSGLAN